MPLRCKVTYCFEFTAPEGDSLSGHAAIAMNAAAGMILGGEVKNGHFGNFKVGNVQVSWDATVRPEPG